MRVRAAAALIVAACAVSAEDARGAGWLAPVDLAGSGNQFGEQAVVTSRGEMVAAWVAVGPSGSRLQTSVRPPGGSFSAPADLVPLGHMENLDLTTDPAGNVILTWRGVVDSTKDDIRLYY